MHKVLFDYFVFYLSQLLALTIYLISSLLVSWLFVLYRNLDCHYDNFMFFLERPVIWLGVALFAGLIWPGLPKKIYIKIDYKNKEYGKPFEKLRIINGVAFLLLSEFMAPHIFNQCI